VRVTELWVYPIKSCRGVPVESVRVLARGFAEDRRYMLVDGDGVFLSQRTEPRLALVSTRIEPDAIEVTTAGAGTLRIPLVPPDGPRVLVEIWGHRGHATEATEASAWFSDFLGRSCRLVGMPDEVERPAGSKATPGTLIQYADAYPVLLVGQASLDALNARLATPVGMNRFRPNVVVDAPEPHAEDRWRRAELGSVPFDAVKPCDRCSVPGVDPETGRPGKEPLRTLATYRREEGKVWFGMNLVHRDVGAIAVGDAVVVSERR
jgi:uncharacterized protein YcbX